MKILIVAGVPTALPNEKFDKFIGVDRGALFLAEKGKRLNIAVGDFDSVTSDELAKVTAASDRLVKLPAEKDDTDLEVGLTIATTEFPSAEIVIYGALGGRMDHMLTNLELATTSRFHTFAEQITLADEQNIVKYLHPGKHILPKIPDKKYIGFVQINTADSLAIENAKYPLAAEANFKTIYASNEFIADTMTVSFTQGMLLVIYSKDKK